MIRMLDTFSDIEVTKGGTEMSFIVLIEFHNIYKMDM
jgi:hypothetical protein